MKTQVSNMAALYLRLSHDDGADTESNSIGNQRLMLQRYAKEHRFQIYDEYVDDGYTGTNFERDSFKRMIADIEAKKIGIVLVKDMSRLGRLNAMVTYYTDLYFPNHDVRFIAVNDSIDTDEGDNDIMPFKSILNEYYAKDISKKVRSAKHTMALAGKHMAPIAPYGYMISPDDKHKLIVDDETAPVVKRIFEMSASGMGYYKIASQLYKEKIPVPSAHEYARTGKRHRIAGYSCNYAWRDSTLVHILSNPIYLGHMVNGRAERKSYKNAKIIIHPESEWLIVPNTHPAIISENLYNDVQRLCHIKKRPLKNGGHCLYQGLLKCSDCGQSLSYNRAPNGNIWYACGKYKKSCRAGMKNQCSGHRIREESLTELVLVYPVPPRFSLID